MYQWLEIQALNVIDLSCYCMGVWVEKLIFGHMHISFKHSLLPIKYNRIQSGAQIMFIIDYYHYGLCSPSPYESAPPCATVQVHTYLASLTHTPSAVAQMLPAPKVVIKA